jgi:hypothetical protein
MVNDFLKLGLWPASFERVETVFSVDVLKDSLLSFLECHTTASQYFSRLRRCTNYAFPETVTVSFALSKGIEGGVDRDTEPLCRTP